jgi:hypothetical protein
MSDASSDMFYQGETAWWKQVDLKDLGDTSFLIPIENDLEILGFELLGDFICSALTNSINRAWTNRNEHTYVLIQVGFSKPESKLGVLCVFYDSVFSDGISLTTTATRALKDRQTKTSYRRVCNWSNAYNLFQEHKKFIEELAAKHGPTVPNGENLLSIVKLMDKATLQYSPQPDDA